MNGKQILGIILLVAGFLALAYGGFTYTKDEHQIDVGPIELAVKDKETVSIPIWAGVASALAGIVILATSKRT